MSRLLKYKEWNRIFEEEESREEKKLVKIKNGGIVTIKWPNCNLKKKYWYKNNRGGYHRKDGPAVLMWHENGEKKYESWIIDGTNYNRKGGPSVTEWRDDGTKKYEGWYKNGIVHREDGPVEITYLHEGSIESLRWCIEGEFMTKKEWER